MSLSSHLRDASRQEFPQFLNVASGVSIPLYFVLPFRAQTFCRSLYSFDGQLRSLWCAEEVEGRSDRVDLLEETPDTSTSDRPNWLRRLGIYETRQQRSRGREVHFPGVPD